MCQLPNDRHAEAEDMCRRAALGDLALALAHECSNFLNVVLLQLAVLEMEASEAVGPQLEEIRRQGGKLQKFLEQFRMQRRAEAQQLSPISLERAWQGLPHESRKRWPQPAADLPPVLATEIDVRHLLEFLLTHALQWDCDAAPLEAVASGTRVHLRLHCADGSGEGESLEWVACQSLARRLQGRAYSKAAPEGGRDYIIELQQATQEP